MAQRTMNTRLAATHETRQQLEDEIARLRADLARRPPVTEAQNHSNRPFAWVCKRHRKPVITGNTVILNCEEAIQNAFFKLF